MFLAKFSVKATCAGMIACDMTCHTLSVDRRPVQAFQHVNIAGDSFIQQQQRSMALQYSALQHSCLLTICTDQLTASQKHIAHVADAA